MELKMNNKTKLTIAWIAAIISVGGAIFTGLNEFGYFKKHEPVDSNPIVETVTITPEGKFTDFKSERLKK